MRLSVFGSAAVVLLYGAVYTGPGEVAYAATTTAAPSMSQAIGALVTTAAVARGFTASDPRIAATIAAMGQAALASASAVAAASGEALAAVPWVAALTPLAVFAAALAVPTNLGNDSLTAWQLNSNGTVTVTHTSSSSSGSSASPFAALTPGMTGWWAGPNGIEGTSAEAVEEAFMYQGGYYAKGDTLVCDVSTPTTAGCSVYASNGVYIGVSVGPALQTQAWSGTATCSSGEYSTSAGCLTYTPPPPPPPVTESLASAAAGLASSDLADDLSSYLFADAVNALWSQAATEEGYSGLPYPVNAPVTSGEAATVEGQLGSAAPTVGSLTGGAGTLTGAASTPFGVSTPASTSSASATTVATDPGSGAQVNLGPDPGIGAPSLESPPTAAQILAPILGLMADLKTWAVPAHTSECPEPSFELWGQTYAFTTQCDLLEQYGSQITVAFEVGFAVAAVLIVLTA